MKYYSNGLFPSPTTPENFTLSEKVRKKEHFFKSIHCLYYYYYFIHSIFFLFGFN